MDDPILEADERKARQQAIYHGWLEKLQAVELKMSATVDRRTLLRDKANDWDWKFRDEHINPHHTSTAVGYAVVGSDSGGCRLVSGPVYGPANYLSDVVSGPRIN